MATSTEPAWLRHPPPPDKPRNPKAARSPPQSEVSVFEVVDLDTSEERCRRPPLSLQVTDLTADPPPQDECEVLDAGPEPGGAGGGASLTAASLQHDAGVLTSADDLRHLHGEIPSELDLHQTPPLTEGDSSSEESFHPDSSRGNFQLQLEDSGAVEDEEMEEEEQKLLAKLLMDGSFNVNKSLSESWSRRQEDTSMEDSVVGVRKKRAPTIQDSDEEELKSPLDGSFQVLEASTPKSAAPRHSRKSVGGNASVVSRRSLLQSIIQDVEDEDEDDEDVSGFKSEERNMDELQTDMNGETLNMEEEEEAEEGSSLNLQIEEEPECQRKEEPLCAAESYEVLVKKGKESYSQAKLDEALSFFLRAIDIRPGDPEVQFMTIQLYRQLSQRP